MIYALRVIAIRSHGPRRELAVLPGATVSFEQGRF
jgi:hypothetical protein